MRTFGQARTCKGVWRHRPLSSSVHPAAAPGSITMFAGLFCCFLNICLNVLYSCLFMCIVLLLFYVFLVNCLFTMVFVGLPKRAGGEQRERSKDATGVCEKTLLRRRRHVGISVVKAPHQGEDRGCCYRIAWSRLAAKECLFHRHRYECRHTYECL